MNTTILGYTVINNKRKLAFSIDKFKHAICFGKTFYIADSDDRLPFGETKDSLQGSNF